MNVRLAEPCRSSPLEFSDEEIRRMSQLISQRSISPLECATELNFGFFFDGTNNNADLRRTANPSVQDPQGLSDREKFAHSNIARLFDVYPDNRYVRGCFRTYAPGVGTRFDDIGDRGDGDSVFLGIGSSTDRRRGLAFAEKGEARILWGLLQAINNVHRYFFGETMISLGRVKELANALAEQEPPSGWRKLVTAFSSTFAAMFLGSDLVHVRERIDQRRRKVLKGYTDDLKQRIAPYRELKPKVQLIRVSIFGFSRGAAQARAFATWFEEMCYADSGTTRLTLGGIPVSIDFIGLFDTVASVGLANSAVITDGHMAWADAERTMRIPITMPCLHLVSAHEVRRSFPLDSIRVQENYLSDKHREVVYPGVHSDVGGGYMPREQGRGTDAKGSDMLSNIPLAEMYREARLAGVPLNVDATDRGVTPQAKQAFNIAPQTIKAFNDYIAICSAGKNIAGNARLEDIFREQKALYVRWRKDRVDSMDRVPSVVRAAPQDRTDLINANIELREEARLLQTPLSDVQIRAKLPRVPVVVIAREFVRMVTRDFDWFNKRGIDPGHYEEWKQLEGAWNAGNAPAAASNLFDNYVHDSRAWFKVTGDDDHIWERPFKERWEALERRDRQWQGMSGHQSPGCAPTLARGGDPLTILERRELERYRTHGIPTQPGGREPYWLGAGYLRFRRIYFGADNLIILTTKADGSQEYQKVNPFALPATNS